jgi:hypothetical protein
MIDVIREGRYWAIGHRGHYTVYRKDTGFLGERSTVVAEFYTKSREEEVKTCNNIKNLISCYKDREFVVGGIADVRRYMATASG